MSNLKIIKQIKLIRNLNEDNFRNLNPDEKYFYKKDSKVLHEIGLAREINVKDIKKIFLDAMEPNNVRKFWGINELTEVHLDGYIGIKLHHFLRLTTAEASRPELWNSLIFQIPEAIEFIDFRKSFKLNSPKELKLSDVFVKQSSQVHNLNRISGSWWVVELTRNGESYKSSMNAFLCTTYFTDRYMTMNLMHLRQIAVGMANYFVKNDQARDLLATRDRVGDNPQFSATLNDFLASNNFESSFVNIESDYNNFSKWQTSKRKQNILNDGPKDFKVTDRELTKVFKLFDDLIAQRN